MDYSLKSADLEPPMNIYSNQAVEQGLLDLKKSDAALVYMTDGSFLVIGDKDNAQTTVLYALSDLLSHDESFRASICKWILLHQDEIARRMSRPLPKG